MSEYRLMYNSTGLATHQREPTQPSCTSEWYTVMVASRRNLSQARLVSPIMKQSIPRLELLGAVILFLKALPKQVNRINYWVDSRTVLCWIQNDKHWKQYFKQRVDEIRQMTAKKDWR